MQEKPYKFSIAPMMGYSHRHFIHFMRLLTQESLIFTEMLPADAICANPRRMCDWHLKDMPIAVQLGGSNACKLAEASRIIADYGCQQINLNMGCPSPRVKKGAFGACLMEDGNHSAELVRAMAKACALPITVKLRIGVDAYRGDDTVDEPALHELLAKLIDAGASEIHLHARKAILSGLNPKENREVPPLRYDIASRARQKFPKIPFILNGGIADIDHALDHLQNFDGVMVGRAIVKDPFAFAFIDSKIFNKANRFDALTMRSQVFEHYCAYLENQLANPVGSARYLQKSIFSFLLQPLFALPMGLRGARKWRQILNQFTHDFSEQGSNHHLLIRFFALKKFIEQMEMTNQMQERQLSA